MFTTARGRILDAAIKYGWSRDPKTTDANPYVEWFSRGDHYVRLRFSIRGVVMTATGNDWVLGPNQRGKESYVLEKIKEHGTDTPTTELAPVIRLTPQQQFAIKLLMQAHANGRTSVNSAVLKLNGKTRGALRTKGVIGYDDTPFEFEGITLTGGRYTFTNDGLALGHRLHPDVLWCPVDVDGSPCGRTEPGHVNHYTAARLEAGRAAMRQLGDELNSMAAGIADALEAAPATNNQHFASPAHDDRKQQGSRRAQQAVRR